MPDLIGCMPPGSCFTILTPAFTVTAPAGLDSTGDPAFLLAVDALRHARYERAAPAECK